MVRVDLFSDFEGVLLAYHAGNKESYIQLSDLLDILEFHVSKEISAHTALEDRLKELLENLRRTAGVHSVTFMNLSVLNLIDSFFTSQLEYHGMYVIAALDYMKDRNFVDRPLFNSALASEIPTIQYFDRIKSCQLAWVAVSSDFKNELTKLAFVYPTKQL